MRRIALLTLFIAFLVPMFASAPAHAQATRTWVSGVGDDANPCSRTAPCKTFAGAISKTAAAGEIDCLDPGGFGGITITKSITLNCSATLGSILVAGTNGVTISAATTDRVILRNMQIQGINQGLVGVKIITAGVVSIENCVITQFTQQGIADSRTSGGTKLFIRNTIVSHNTLPGISVSATGPNDAVIETSSSINNAYGVAVGNGNNVAAKQSVFSGNTTAGVEADSGGQLTVDNSVISSNATGVVAGGTIRLSNNDINFNSAAAFSGSPVSYGNNRVLGTQGSALTTANQQ
jgi:hypothetical protein